MTLGELDPGALARDLAGGGVALRTGPFRVRVRTPIAALARALHLLYAAHPLADGRFCDYHVEVAPPRGIRRWLRPQVEFRVDGRAPFAPLPASQALPFLEWGLNWCIASQAHRFLIVHAAALERGGRALVLPGEPGAGKSTLTAALAHRGWRLLSDELALLDPSSGELRGLARPVSLKNESIGVMRAYLPDAVLGDECRDTSKGTVALLRPPDDSVRRVDEPARPAWIVTPRWVAGAHASLEPCSRATTFMELAHNAFNYSIQGGAGFDALARMVDECDSYHFTYARLDDAVSAFERLAGTS